MANIPPHFDGNAFETYYNLTDEDWSVSNGVMICPSLPNLTTEDLAVFVVDLEQFVRVKDREENAKPNAKAVPGWAVWDEAQANDWYNVHISDAQIEAVSNLEEAKVIMKDMSLALRNLGIIVIAMRDRLWPDLPE